MTVRPFAADKTVMSVRLFRETKRRLIRSTPLLLGLLIFSSACADGGGGGTITEPTPINACNGQGSYFRGSYRIVYQIEPDLVNGIAGQISVEVTLLSKNVRDREARLNWTGWESGTAGVGQPWNHDKKTWKVSTSCDGVEQTLIDAWTPTADEFTQFHLTSSGAQYRLDGVDAPATGT
jgi:hypothetical protein